MQVTRYLWPDPAYKVVKREPIDRGYVSRRKPWQLYRGSEYVGCFKTKREANGAIPRVEV